PMLGTLVLCLIGTTWAQLDLSENGISMRDGQMMGDDLLGLSTRDSEAMPGPIKFGTKYMTGGAGEGDQQLTEDGEYKHREQVKSDNVLPAYCEPPNPCPVGYTAEHGCLEEFENSAEFSREYQAQQHCICDQEHMFNCAKDQASDSADNLQNMLDDDESDNEMHHQAMIAKKFHEKRAGESFAPRRKRSIDPAHHAPNPYLKGEPLRSMQKKDGHKSWIQH
ncbi:hypothetical protein PFISCL1PPCAC_920, partial [Pristionchus fissidentatus]